MGHLCQQIKGNGHQSRLVDLIDTLTAPTLKPKAKKANGVEPKLTIITPSSVVAVSTARPPTTSTTTNPRPLTTSSINEANEVTNRGQVQRDDNITVSHSVSVVSVKYSFDESRTQHPETSSKLNQNTTTSNGAGLNQSSPESVESASETSAIISLSSIDQQQSNNSNSRDRAPKSIVSVTTRQPQPQTQFRDENLFIQLSDRSLTTSSTTSTTSTSTTSIKEATS